MLDLDKLSEIRENSYSLLLMRHSKRSNMLSETDPQNGVVFVLLTDILNHSNSLILKLVMKMDSTARAAMKNDITSLPALSVPGILN